MKMKKRLQGLILGIFIGVILTGGVVFSQQISKTAELCYHNIKIFIDGEEIIPRDVQGNVVEPFTMNDTTYLPVRAIADAFGKDVTWDEETQSVYIDSPQEFLKNSNADFEEKVTMYAPDGRTLVIAKDEVPAYKKVGWYETYQEAMAVNQTNNYENVNTRGVYRTPKGKRYHLDPDCGGKNSYSTTLQKAKNAGLTPCKKCAQ